MVIDVIKENDVIVIRFSSGKNHREYSINWCIQAWPCDRIERIPNNVDSIRENSWDVENIAADDDTRNDVKL